MLLSLLEVRKRKLKFVKNIYLSYLKYHISYAAFPQSLLDIPGIQD